MPISPEEINGSKLPAGVRGYRRAETDDLLQRVAWDYRQLLHSEKVISEELRGLRQRNEALEAQVSSAQQAHAQTEQRAAAEHTQRNEALEAQIASLEAQLSSLQEVLARHEQRERAEEETKVRAREHVEGLEAEIASLRAALAHHESREALTSTLVANAQRAARELRESAREESETILKKARHRAAEIEDAARAAVKDSTVEVGRLQKMQNDLRDRLRQTLQSVLAEVQEEEPPQTAASPPGVSQLRPRSSRVARK